MSSAVFTSDLSLDVCAQEPIRIPGGIQPHGTLVVVDPRSRCIVQASANAASVLNVSHGGGAVHGKTLQEVIGAAAEAQINGWLNNTDSNYLRTLEINSQRLQVLGHQTAQGTILEFEPPPASEGETLEAFYPRIGRFMEDVAAYEDLTDLCTAAAREFRQISGFNRVLIYRFDAQWNGEVLAEDSDGVLPSYAGLRFPATDIPPQARELYRLNRLRLIPDANYAPVPIEPLQHPDGTPLDLSFAALRSVSPVHLEYMRNMGTLASMSISVLVDGKLWGLVSCHNGEPRRVNAQARTACDLLGKVLSQHIGSRERGAYAAKRIELKRIESELLTLIAPSESFQAGLAANGRIWLQLADAGGAAILHDDAIVTAGVTPPPDRLRALTEKIHQQGLDSFTTDSLALQWPEFEDLTEVASGVLAISISQLHPSYIFWFRPEVQRTVLWAGDPRKPMAPSEQRLHPRNSFASWKEQVRSRALPWSQAEIDGVLDFRNAIINFVLRRAEERAALTHQLQRSNRELESFSYSVSHDLRAPFRHIVGYTQLLRDREKTLTDKSLHYLDSINEAAASAGQLVDDLLAFSQLGRTQLAVSPVDMQKVTQEIIRSMEPDVRYRQVEWRIQPLPATRGDQALIRQALYNLVDNALKYSKDRTPAIIEISGEQRGEECVYQVRDNGVGFDMAYAHKLFGVFQRLHRMEDFAGTGIGLALTQRIIERHGGWIKAHGAIDQGATFQFGLPARTVA